MRPTAGKTPDLVQHDVGANGGYNAYYHAHKHRHNTSANSGAEDSFRS